MEIREFIDSILETARSFPWIRRTEVNSTIAFTRIRLWLNNSYVDVFYRRRTQNTSYAAGTLSIIGAVSFILSGLI
jgi:hypothetical protein